MTRPAAAAAADGDSSDPARSTRHRTSDVRAALVVAAQDVLEREGMAGLTVRTVATEAGVAPMGVYNHFSDKGGLLLAVLMAAFDQLAADTAWRADLAPRAALREVGYGYRRFALAHPTTYELMFGTGARVSRAVQRAGDHSDRAFDRLLHAVQTCQHLGIVRHGEPAVMAMTIWSAVHGAVSLETSGCMPPGFDGEDAFAAVLEMIDRGLSPSEAD